MTSSHVAVRALHWWWTHYDSLWPLTALDPALQVLSMLGSVKGQRIVELGAGIGRFTGELARTARAVLAVGRGLGR